MSKWQRRLIKVENDIRARNKRAAQTIVDAQAQADKSNAQAQVAKIKNFAREQFDAAHVPTGIDVYIRDNTCEITFSGFWSEPEITFDFLARFAEFFDSRKINIPATVKDNDGCPSCRYGESWQFSLSISDIPEKFFTI